MDAHRNSFQILYTISSQASNGRTLKSKNNQKPTYWSALIYIRDRLTADWSHSEINKCTIGLDITPRILLGADYTRLLLINVELFKVFQNPDL